MESVSVSTLYFFNSNYEEKISGEKMNIKTKNIYNKKTSIQR